MRGFLTFQILWEINKSPLNGQQISNQIAKRRGSKPTPGTIYPALRDLKERGLIQGTKQGNQIIYQLTESGQQGLSEACRYFYQLFGDIIRECKYIASQPKSC
jgi:DNA-binding PadR family transcriptional regulator